MGGVVILALQSRKQRLRGLHCWLPVIATGTGWDQNPDLLAVKSLSIEPQATRFIHVACVLKLPSEAQAPSYHPLVLRHLS